MSNGHDGGCFIFLLGIAIVPGCIHFTQLLPLSLCVGGGYNGINVNIKMHFEFHRMRSQKSFTLIELLIVTLKKTMQRIVSGGRQASSFTLIELLIVTPQRKLLRSFQRGKSASSFTLIELLIVIGILAILVAAVVVVLDPAQLLAQARDSKRQQDLSALNQALNTVYALDQTVSFGTSSIVYTSLPDSSSTCGSWGLPSLPTGWTYNCVPTSTLQNTNGTGWIPVNFQSNGVVNLSSLPTDPVNSSSTGLYYTYVTGGSFELTAAFESTKYKMGGGNDQASTDGGSYPDLYELGSNLSLQPIDHGDPSLVGYWPLNEGTGTIAYDRSGNNNNGIWVGTAPYWGGSPTSGYFSGSTTCNSIGTSTLFRSLLSNFSVTVWFNSTATQSKRLVSKGYVAQWEFELRGNNCLGMNFNNSGTNYFLSNQYCGLQNNVWYQATFVINNNTLYTYLNGSLVKMTTLPAALMQSTNPLVIGSYNSCSADGTFSGYIFGVRIYNRALSASEIQALYNATK